MDITVPRQLLTTSNQSSMLSDTQPTSIQSMYANLGLNSLSAVAKLQQEAPGIVNPSEEWSNSSVAAMMKSALQVQHVASRQVNSNTMRNNLVNNGITGRIPQYDKIIKIGRRCSLGFVRGMGRRGSLLFDGDEVIFGDKKFHFTNNY